MRRVVERKLELLWSPQQISAWLARQWPDDAEMRVSHKTIYLSLFVQGRGALRQELHNCLRSARPRGADGPFAAALKCSAMDEASSGRPPATAELESFAAHVDLDPLADLCVRELLSAIFTTPDGDRASSTKLVDPGIGSDLAASDTAAYIANLSSR